VSGCALLASAGCEPTGSQHDRGPGAWFVQVLALAPGADPAMRMVAGPGAPADRGQDSLTCPATLARLNR
jgi:hypothetical protein